MIEKKERKTKETTWRKTYELPHE